MTPAEFEDAKALWKFFYAHECFKQVENACSFIIDNSLDENHPAYYPLITAIYVLYGKPFKRSNVVGKLPRDIVPAEFQQLHKIIMDHRDQLYAHTDAESFDLGGHGAANQVRVLVSPTEARLFGTQFRARPPVLPKVVELCRAMQKKANYHLEKLQKRHQKKVPAQPGEYALNVLDLAGPFLIKKPPMLS
jgi:hypothetical protein